MATSPSVLRQFEQFDLVAFRGINKGKGCAGTTFGRAIGKFYPMGFNVFLEFVHGVDFKCKVDEVFLYLNRAGIRIVGNLDQFFTAGGFEECQLGSPGGSVAADFFKAEDGFVEFHGAFEVIDAHPCVVETGYNGHVLGFVVIRGNLDTKNIGDDKIKLVGGTYVAIFLSERQFC